MITQQNSGSCLCDNVTNTCHKLIGPLSGHTWQGFPASWDCHFTRRLGGADPSRRLGPHRQGFVNALVHGWSTQCSLAPLRVQVRVVTARYVPIRFVVRRWDESLGTGPYVSL